MALLWIEGFDGYTTGYPADPISYLERRYEAVQSSDRWRIASGRSGNYSLWGGIDSQVYIITPPITTNDTLVIGFAFKTDSTGSGPYRIVSFFDTITEGMNLRYKDNGELGIYRQNTHLETTVSLGLGTATWYYVEMKIKCHDTTGTYDVQVDGTPVLSATGVDTKQTANNYHNRAGFWSGAPGFTFDDAYILDSSGSKNNNFLGDSTVTPIYPNGDSSIAWTRSGGSTNAENVDEYPSPDDDTTYVESDTVNNTDLYDYTNLGSLGPSIYGLQINTDCKETDAEPFDLLIPMKLGATQNDGSSMSVGTASWITKMRVAEDDPTGNTWTLTNLNAAKFGVKVG
jgi:hypothetical protein